MGLLSTIVNQPTFGKLVFKLLKRKAFKLVESPLEETLEKQKKLLESKFKRLEATTIGKKMGVKKQSSLNELPITDYDFYHPFYNNPTSDAFMYPLDSYVRSRTSGTQGKEKWFMMPKIELKKSVLDTFIPLLFLLFHDGEKSTLEHGDTVYANVATRPFTSGYMGEETAKYNLINIVPNMALPFKDKVNYFIRNHQKIDGALILASTLISKIFPEIQKPIQLKGLGVMDAQIAEIYKKEIEEYTGTKPKTAYYSTETFVCSHPSIQYPLGFFFDWQRGIYEFVPVKEEDENKTVSLDQVRVGELYNLYFTSFYSELTRYNTKNCFRCIAKGDDIIGTDFPIFKLHARLEKTISLHNFTRISEDELLTAFQRAEIRFVDFTARVEVKKGLQYLVIYTEITKPISQKELEENLHRELYNMNQDYQNLVDFFEYTPLKVEIMPAGVFTKYLQEKLGSVPKVDRINMNDEEFKKLLDIAKMS